MFKIVLWSSLLCRTYKNTWFCQRTNSISPTGTRTHGAGQACCCPPPECGDKGCIIRDRCEALLCLAPLSHCDSAPPVTRGRLHKTCHPASPPGPWRPGSYVNVSWIWRAGLNMDVWKHVDVHDACTCVSGLVMCVCYSHIPDGKEPEDSVHLPHWPYLFKSARRTWLPVSSTLCLSVCLPASIIFWPHRCYLCLMAIFKHHSGAVNPQLLC